MSNDDLERGHLAPLAESERTGLDDQARARVISALRNQGPKVVRRARIQRQVVRVGSVVSAAFVALMLSRFALEPTAETDGAAPLAQRCDAYASAGQQFTTESSGASVLDLGARALLRTTPGTRVRVEADEPCRLIIALEHGRVLVHAKDLGGGELRVRTKEGDVTVHGTIFSVESLDDALTVDVAEGLVEVGTGRPDRTMARRGDRVRKSSKKIERSSLEEEAVDALIDDVELGFDELAMAEDIDEVDAPSEDSKRPRKTRVRPRRRRARRSSTRPPKPPVTESIPAVTEATPDVAETPEIPRVEPPPAPESLAQLLARAERLRGSGDVDGARAAYSSACERPGPDARAAWVGLARLELSVGRIEATRAALAQYARRGGGTLEPEAAWISVRAEDKAGKIDRARAEATALVSRWPTTPQAQAAHRWLEEHPE